MDLDLNIENYSFEDMLNLFNMPYEYDETDLKKALKIVSKLHPDKKTVSNDIFIFFYKVYKILLNFYKIKQRDTYREDFSNDSEKELLKQFSKKKNFNKLFNQLFEKNVNIEKGNGYGNWLKNNNKTYKTTNNVNDYFEEKHNSIIKMDTVNDLKLNTGGSLLIENDNNSYNSDIFSKLNYDDVKKVYSETHIQVSNNIEKRQFSSADELKRFRNNTIETPFDKEQSLNLINEKNRSENNENMRQMFKLFKDDEKHKKEKNNWWTNFKKLTI